MAPHRVHSEAGHTVRPFRCQLEAIGTALIIIRNLPEGTIWALTCTNDDEDARSPTVLNIFAPEKDWESLAERLHLPEPPVDESPDAGDQYRSYLYETLLISLIVQENQ